MTKHSKLVQQALKMDNFHKNSFFVILFVLVFWICLVGYRPNHMSITMAKYDMSFCLHHCSNDEHRVPKDSDLPDKDWSSETDSDRKLDSHHSEALHRITSRLSTILPMSFRKQNFTDDSISFTPAISKDKRNYKINYTGSFSFTFFEKKRIKDSELNETSLSVGRRLPQCLIIGVRKGGTRALIEFLNLHPSIRSQKHEVHFFDDNINYSHGLEWYRQQMPLSGSDQLTIEKTPAYFVKDQAPERVYLMNASIKLLLIVRNPVERTLSDYTQVKVSKEERGKLYSSFETLVFDPLTGRIRRNYRAVRRSIYHRHMKRWLAFFQMDQIHLVSGEEMVTNPFTELKKIEHFLGLKPELRSNQFYLNATRGFYCMNLNNGRKRCLHTSKGRNHVDVRQQVLRKLTRFFRPHNEKFYKMVGRDFGWPK